MNTNTLTPQHILNFLLYLFMLCWLWGNVDAFLLWSVLICCGLSLRFHFFQGSDNDSVDLPRASSPAHHRKKHSMESSRSPRSSKHHHSRSRSRSRDRKRQYSLPTPRHFWICQMIEFFVSLKSIHLLSHPQDNEILILIPLRWQKIQTKSKQEQRGN